MVYKFQGFRRNAMRCHLILKRNFLRLSYITAMDGGTAEDFSLQFVRCGAAGFYTFWSLFLQLSNATHPTL